MSLPLEGIRVLELAQIIAGPYCAHQLGLFGAEVIKVEPPGTGEFLRQRPPAPAGVNSSWMMFNPGKKSITLNLKHPRGLELVMLLLEDVDVLVENSPPPALQNLRLASTLLAT